MPTLDHNRIFARWLQRRVLLVGNGSDVVLLGENASALGPDAQRLRFQTRGAAPVIGRFHLYDSDFVDLHERGTLLGVSDWVTVAPDSYVWVYES